MTAKITSNSFGATQTETLEDAVTFQTSSSSTSQKDTHIDFFLRLLENPSIQSNPSISFVLESQVEELMHHKSQELTSQQEETYAWAKKLLIDQKVSSFVAKKLLQMHASASPQQSSSKSVSPAATPEVSTKEPPTVTPVSALPAIAFGAAEWKKYFGDVGEEPPLPPDINDILAAPCPFWAGKKVKKTHLLVLVPQTVNGQPLTMKSLDELVRKPLQGIATQYRNLSLGLYTDSTAPKSHWALLTRDLIVGSRSKPYITQQALIIAPYEVPTILDASVALFMERVRNGTKLYSDSPRTFTRCQEKYGANWQLAVGGFSDAGLYVYNGDGDCDSHGIGGLRKFEEPSKVAPIVVASTVTVSPQLSSSKSESPAVSPVVPKMESPKVTPVVTALVLPSNPSIAFGASEWNKYFGDVGVEPPLPPDIQAILSAPCSFWPGKKVQDTHLLVLVPQTVNGQPLTLKSLGELVKKPLQGSATEYDCLELGEYTDLAASKSHWALLTRDVVEGSRSKPYSAQQALIKAPYKVPTILDATVAIFMEHVRTGTRLYSDSPYTYTRCQEKYDVNWQLVVGGFSAAGVLVDDDDGDDDFFGVGGLRKF